MPDEPPPQSEPDPLNEPTRMANSDHPTGDTWRLQQTPITGGKAASGGGSQPAELIGDFEVVGRLGQGGMGTVYRARQRSLDRLVALKILPAKLETDAEYVARFQREARVAANLSHPNLVRVYTSGSTTGCHYIAMELIEGETLADRLKRGPTPPLEAVRIILAATQALEYGWRIAQLIHRDIKPGNIFLSREGAVKLGDLGLAKTSGADSTGLTQTGAMMGTPYYISPEQARGDKDLDFRADIYSLGCTLFQMLTGRTPYEGRDPFAVMNMHVNAAPPAILKIMPLCPLPLARLVSKTLRKQRRERPGSYEELIAQLEGIEAMLDPARVVPSLEGAALSAPTHDSKRLGAHEAAPSSLEGRRGAASLPPKSYRPLYFAVAAGIVGLAMAGYFLWPKKKEELTAAQRWALEHAGEKKSDAANDPRLPATMPSIIGWQDVMEKTKTSFRNAGHGDFSEEDGWIVATVQGKSGFPIDTRKLNDLAVRGKFRGRVSVVVHDHSPTSHYRVYFLPGRVGYIERIENNPGAPAKFTRLETFLLPEGSDHEFLVAFTGLDLRVWMDGKLLTSTRDTMPASGSVALAIESPGSAVRDLAVADLTKNTAMTRPATPAATPRGVVNLLALVDVKRDAVTGNWSVTPEGLALERNGRLEFNYSPPAEYDFATEFTIQAGNSGDVAQVLTLSGRNIHWSMLPPAGFGPKLDGLNHGDPKRTEALAHGMHRFKPGERHRSVVEVRANSLRALLDGVEVAQFSGDLQRLVSDNYNMRDGRHLGVKAENGMSVLFHKVEVWPAGASAGAAPAASVHSAPPPPFSPSTEPWVDALADPAALKLRGSVKRTSEGLEWGDKPGRVDFSLLTGPDYAVRVLARANERSSKTWLYLRHTTSGYDVIFNGSDHVSIGRYDDGKFTTLNKFSVARAVKPGDTYELEARIVGQKITVALDGVTLGSVEDDSLTTGGPSIDVGSIIRGVQYLDLSSPAKTGAEPAAIKLWNTPEKLKEGSGVHWENGAVAIQEMDLRTSTPLRDVILRASIRMNPEARTPQVHMRVRSSTPPGGDYYRLGVSPSAKEIQLETVHAGKSERLQKWPLPRAYGPEEWLRLELRAVGDELTVTADGQALGTVHDTSQPQAGYMSLYSNGPGYFRDIEYVPLELVK